MPTYQNTHTHAHTHMEREGGTDMEEMQRIHLSGQKPILMLTRFPLTPSVN